MTVRIDVISDVVCPWCYIGKRHLERALALWNGSHPDAPAEVHWHPFELNPDLPAGGVDRRAYLEAKFGGAARAGEIYARVQAAGRHAGIAFEFERIAVQPNSLDAHRLVWWAAGQGRQDAMVEALFQGYFLEGRDYSSREVLADVAGAAGCDARDALAFLASGEGADAVREDERVAARIGVSGVPFFIVGERHALSGAQPPEAIVQALQQSLEAAA